MCCMVVTLKRSRLSGWLNADAYCRESKGGHTIRCVGRGAEYREARGHVVGDRGTSSVQGEGSTAD
mgnify:CR=1 FL=1